MHIGKQSLLTRGPAPLYPPALHAMMSPDIYHPTVGFRNVPNSALADLNEVMAASNDVLYFAASGGSIAREQEICSQPAATPAPAEKLEFASA